MYATVAVVVVVACVSRCVHMMYMCLCAVLQYMPPVAMSVRSTRRLNMALFNSSGSAEDKLQAFDSVDRRIVANAVTVSRAPLTARIGTNRRDSADSHTAAVALTAAPSRSHTARIPVPLNLEESDNINQFSQGMHAQFTPARLPSLLFSSFPPYLYIFFSLEAPACPLVYLLVFAPLILPTFMCVCVLLLFLDVC